VDANDIQLVEMLANLAEENETTTNIDDDSVLGSQYSIFSEVAKDDPEEEEVEDLNITSLDLDNWISMSEESDKRDDIENIYKQNTESANSSNVVEENCENTFTDFPQFDGIDNSYENILKYGKISTNCLVNKNNNTKKYCITVFSKNTQHAVRVINTAKNRALCNFYKNLSLMDVIKHFNINNPNQYHLKKELYNFLNRYYFHIFIKTDKNLMRNIYTNNLYSDKNAVIRKIYYLKDKQDNILNKKTKKKLYITYYQIQLDHQDLDVYDIDDIEAIGTIDDINQHNTTDYEKNKYNYMQDTKLYFQRRTLLNSNCCSRHKSCISSKFIISSIDGAIGTDSSDSELETDITIDKQEKRICVYKSGKKDIQSMVQITPKKRKLDFEESPNKRKNITIRTPKKQYSSPDKMHRSPRLSGNYSPLNITITSPKTSKSPLRKYESIKEKHVMMSDAPSTSTTPKHKRYPLHMSLFREKHVRNLPNLNIGK